MIPTVTGVTDSRPGTATGSSLHLILIGARADGAGAGTLTVTRPARAADLVLVNEMLARCSLESRCARGLGPLLRPAQWESLTRPDHGFSWVTHALGKPERLIALTQVLQTQLSGQVDLGLMIEDAWQEQGLGKALTLRAVDQARGSRYQSMTAQVAATNHRMLRILGGAGATLSDPANAVVTASLDLEPRQSVQADGRRW